MQKRISTTTALIFACFLSATCSITAAYFAHANAQNLQEVEYGVLINSKEIERARQDVEKLRYRLDSVALACIIAPD